MKVHYLAAPISKTNMSVMIDSGGFLMRPEFKANNTSRVSYRDDNRGDNPISTNAIFVDGGRIFSLGWTTGFAEHSIDDAGTLSLVYNDLKPDGSNSGGNSFAVDTINKLICVGKYSTNKMTVYDYSGGAISKTGTITPSTSNLQSGQTGYAYFNGYAFAGEWLYLGSYLSTSTANRYNVNTDTAENLTVANKGSNMYHGRTVYHSETDRMFILSYTSGGVWVVDDASTATPDAWYMSPQTLGFGNNNCYNGGVHYVSGDDVYLMANRKIAKVHVEKGNYYRIGNVSDTHYAQPWNGCTGIHTISERGDLTLVHADRGYNRLLGFYDNEHDKVVGSTKRTMTPYASQTPLYADYGMTSVQVTSPNGTKYNVLTGYGGNMNKFYVFAEDDDLVFKDGAWEVIFYGPSLSSDDKAIHLNIEDLYVMSSSTFNAYYSRDGGSTWYSITPNTTQELQGSGTGTIRIKFSGTCTESSCAYIRSNTPPSIILLNEYVTSRSQPQLHLGRTA